ncbi:hypothetical protein [Paenibacillus borealis]|uniref:Uncharacterized protein n=1 Tax=Paenibacillus borealis TaxID=160799 RepID=A0A089LDA6_PAEBO|nr:hypothetical protein [Paenibacillus borealis]AIQ58075.1 hypothetical protein PBOR_14920 [Paenibacillus borealis]
MKIETYLKKPDLILPGNFMDEPNKYFIHIDNENEIEKYIHKFDLRYLDGAIVIEWNYKIVMDYNMWDSVNWLWGFLMNALEEYLQVGKGGFLFPDQPIKFEMIKVNSYYMELKIGEGRYGHFKLPSEEFIHALLNGAEHFYRRYKEYFNSHDNAFYHTKIAAIRKHLY